MQILLAEDDERVAKFLREALKADGHEVFFCRNLKELTDAVQSSPLDFEIAILDRMFRGGDDSLSVLDKIREARPSLKILILSAINSAEEKAKALDKGADDYLAKPYSLVELTARLRVLSRRQSEKHTGEATRMQLGNANLDLAEHHVHVGGKRLEFSSKEFQLFSCLMRSPGRVFNKFQLLDRIWNVQSDIESNVVEATVRNVRRKLEDAGATVELKSRRNLGYWIEESA